jgi:mannose-6-phosphate isomerase-like protein (cupin superfamily)
MPEKRRTVPRPNGAQISILISAEESGGRMSMIETISPPRSGPTYHSHANEDETFYVVEGEADIWLGDRVYHCKAGDHLYGPIGVFHTYRNAGAGNLKLVIVYSPGGFEQSFLDTETMLNEGKTQADVAQMLGERYGLTFRPSPADRS